MNARLFPPTLLMTLVPPQRFQRLLRFSPQSTRLSWKQPYALSRPVAPEGSLGLRPCGGGSGWSGGDGETHRAKRRTIGIPIPERLEGRGGYSAAPGMRFAASPARRRLMGLGDKTATTRRPELAEQSSARSVGLRRNGTHNPELRAKARRSAKPSTQLRPDTAGTLQRAYSARRISSSAKSAVR